MEPLQRCKTAPGDPITMATVTYTPPPPPPNNPAILLTLFSSRQLFIIMMIIYYICLPYYHYRNSTFNDWRNEQQSFPGAGILVKALILQQKQNYFSLFLNLPTHTIKSGRAPHGGRYHSRDALRR